MEKRPPFHRQLKRERESRSWSQANVAEKIGVDVKTVNRWENGYRKPLPYYRQMLCQLFEMSAEEFGLLEEINHVQEAVFIDKGANTSIPLYDIPRADWGEAPQFGNFYGRNRELAELKKWIVNDRCRIVAVLGMGGIGKTTLSAELAGQLQDTFEYVFWRSLQNASPLDQILQQCIQFVSDQQRVDLPQSIDKQIAFLIKYLRDHRCLLVLDNVESILQAGEHVGQYREGYENYGTLLQRIGEMQHTSCLLLTSREKPREIARQEGTTLPVRSLHLSGIGYTEGQELLKGKNLFGSREQWMALIHLYSGNPLALKLVSESIEGIFEGDIAKFLAEGESAFGDINDLLEQHFHRLSKREQEILYWLAIEREVVSLENLRENFVRAPSRGALLEALQSLQRRSLIETRGSANFALQPVIMEYITNTLTKRAYEELIGEGAQKTVEAWTNYALIKVQARDYVRDSQVRLILNPVAESLRSTLGKESIGQKLRSMLFTERQKQPQQRSYLAGNALNLLVHLHYDLRGADFSSLMIWQAFLQNATLPDVNFAHAHFVATDFKNTFGSILSLTFSPNGKLLAAGTATDEIWLYQVPDGTPFRTYHGHTDGVWSITFSSDGLKLASSSDDQTIRLWDVNTGQRLKVLPGHTNRVRSVAFNADSTLLASGSDDQTIRLWDVNTAYCINTLYGHSDRVWSVAFNPRGTILASGSTDETICLWDVSIGICHERLHGHTGGVRSIAFNPAGTVLASGSNDQTVRLWDMSTGQCLRVLLGHTNRVWSVAFSPDGQILASASEDHIIRLWDINTGYCLKILQNHTHGVRSVAFSPDGQILASGGDDQTIRLWNVDMGYGLKTLQGHTNRIWSIALSPHGQMLVSGSEDRTIQVWNVQNGHCIYTLQDRVHGPRSVAFSPDGGTFASGGEDQTVRLWNVNTGQCINTLRGHTNWVWSVSFSPDGQALASGSEDHTVRLWEVKTGRSLSTLQGHTSWVRSVAFSPDGDTLASGGDDHTIKLWETSTGRCLSTFEGHTSRIRSVAFSPTQQILASGSEDHTIRLWDINSGRCLHTLQGHSNRVRSISFSPDGCKLISSSEDCSIRIWEVKTGCCLHSLEGHSNRIRSVSFSTEGQTFASSSDDGTIKIWDASLLEPLKTLRTDRPYERMNITGVIGLTEAQKDTLKALGAIEGEERLI
jgi:WD40 repeat protein/transcriptional regulator with XRE-family HTH domain